MSYIATGEAGDEEMAARIERHKAERPADWTTIEAPMRRREAAEAAGPAAFVIVDCLTLSTRWPADIVTCSVP